MNANYVSEIKTMNCAWNKKNGNKCKQSYRCDKYVYDFFFFTLGPSVEGFCQILIVKSYVVMRFFKD